MYHRCFLIMLSFLLLSCQPQETKKQMTGDELISKTEVLYYKDQKWRRTVTSLITSQNEKRTHENSRPKTERGKLADRLIWKDIIEIEDNKNTEELIELTNKYGFPGMDRFDIKFPVCLVFVHSSREYFPEIIAIVNREYLLGNMNDWEKDYILWHVERNRDPIYLPNPKSGTWFGTDEDIMNYFFKKKTP